MAGVLLCPPFFFIEGLFFENFCMFEVEVGGAR